MANKKFVVYGAIIAIYTVISILLGSLSFGMLQIRVAEVLLVLCLYDRKFVLPVTAGCFVTNFIGIINGVNPLVMDLLIGTIATFLSAECVYCFRNVKWFNLPILSLLLPAIINGIMVGAELCFYFSMSPIVLMIYVGLGELLSVTVLGLILYRPIGKAIKQYIDV